MRPTIHVIDLFAGPGGLGELLGRALARTTPGAVGLEDAGVREASAARAKALDGSGHLARMQGDYAEARALYGESLALSRQLRDQQRIAGSLINLGEVARYQGDYARARALYEEGLTILRPLGEQRFLANALGNLGMVASAQGDYAAARALMEESLTIRWQLRDRSGIAGSLEDIAIVAQGQSQPSRAARFEGAASALRESIGSPRSPAGQAEADKTMAAVREALGEAAFAAALGAGRAMTWEQAVEYALAGTDGDAKPSGTPSGPSPTAPS